MAMVDKSIVRPVLDAVETLRASKRDLDFYYKTVDRFSALWNGKPGPERRIEEETAIWLAHDLLKEYLRFEGNTKRVALWLLTINRCCSNYAVDLSRTAAEMKATMENADLDFDRTLLEPILAKVRTFEGRHEKAAETDLGSEDTLGSFLQWVGIYCTYVYPRLRDSAMHDASMISAITFLIAEFIKLQENVSRMAALLLGIKEACSFAAAPAGPDAAAAETGGTVRPGTEEGLVEEILNRLREESAGAPTAGRGGEDWEGRLDGAVRRIAAASPAARGGVLGEEARALEAAAGADREGAAEALRRLLDAEKAGFRERTASTALRMRQDPAAVRQAVVGRMRGATDAGVGLLARLYVLSVLKAAL